MANALQTDLKKKNQQDSNQLYVQAQTAGQAGAGSANLKQASPAAQAGTAGSTMQGLSGMTQKGLSQYGQQYAPSQAVTEAKDYLNSVMGGQPGSFSSQYAGDIASLYDQIMNRPKFEYDVNKDPLFQQYKNQYVVQGQRAMQDVIGNTAALTGGYGNSWGATAGSQAYQTYLQMLNDRIPELEQRAFDRYTAEGDEMRANMNMATTLDNIDYGRYRDTVADWQADRSFAASLYANERNWDQNEWNSMRSYYTQLASLENGDYWTGQNLAENQRQFDLSLEEQKRQADLGDAYKYAALAENARQYDTSFAEDKRQYDIDAAYRQAEADRAADQWLKQYEENIRQYNQNFGESQRQYNEDAAYRQSEAERAANQWQAQFNENVRQADLDEAYRQATLAENIRQYEQNFGESQRQADLDEAYRQQTLAENIRQYDQNYAENVRQADLDEAYRRDTLAENVRQADLDEAYRQAQLAENIRQYEQNFGEDVRQYDKSLEEKVREFNLAHDLDQAEYDFQVQQYMDKLAQLEGGGNGGSSGGGNGGTTEKQNNTEEAKVNIWEGLYDKEKKESTADYSKLKGGKNKTKGTTTANEKKETPTIMNTMSEAEKLKRNGQASALTAKSYQGFTQEQIDDTIKDIEKLFK